MRVFVKVEQESLVERVEASLRKLGFSYLKNRGRTVTGLEVQSPCHFIVTMEDLTKPQLGYPLRERFRIESAIQLVRTPGSKETESEVKQGVSAFVQDLCSDLPDKRWNGLLDLKPLAEKDSWKA